MKLDVILMNDFVVSGRFESKGSSSLSLRTADKELLRRLLLEKDSLVRIYSYTNEFELTIDLDNIKDIEILDE